MTTIAVRTEHDRKQALKMVQGSDLPFTLTKIKGAARSIEQNKLQRLWMRELEEQGDMRAEEYRAYSKAYFGVPILLAENDAFAEQYTAIVKPLPYDQKLEIMKQPIDLPITRIMTSKQKKRYLDDVHTYWTGKGYVLTDPDDMKEARR